VKEELDRTTRLQSSVTRKTPGERKRWRNIQIKSW